jgi:hypothetical protein
MVKIFGKYYYIDIEGIVDKCTTVISTENKDSEIENEINSGLEINVFKYEIIKMCLERVLSEFQERNEDEDIGIFALSDVNISLKIAFNTLIKYNILIEDDE